MRKRAKALVNDRRMFECNKRSNDTMQWSWMRQKERCRLIRYKIQMNLKEINWLCNTKRNGLNLLNSKNQMDRLVICTFFFYYICSMCGWNFIGPHYYDTFYYIIIVVRCTCICKRIYTKYLCESHISLSNEVWKTIYVLHQMPPVLDFHMRAFHYVFKTWTSQLPVQN